MKDYYCCRDVEGAAATIQQALSGENFLEKERRLSEMILQLQIVREQLLSQQQHQHKPQPQPQHIPQSPQPLPPEQVKVSLRFTHCFALSNKLIRFRKEDLIIIFCSVIIFIMINLMWKSSSNPAKPK